IPPSVGLPQLRHDRAHGRSDPLGRERRPIRESSHKNGIAGRDRAHAVIIWERCSEWAVCLTAKFAAELGNYCRSSSIPILKSCTENNLGDFQRSGSTFKNCL